MVSGSTLSVLLGSWLRHQLGITSNFSRRGNPARLEGRRILRTLDSAWSLFQHGLAVLNLGYYDLQRWQANLYWILTFCVVRRACFRWLRWLAPDLSLLASATDQQVKCSAEAWTWTLCLMQNFTQAIAFTTTRCDGSVLRHVRNSNTRKIIRQNSNSNIEIRTPETIRREKSIRNSNTPKINHQNRKSNNG